MTAINGKLADPHRLVDGARLEALNLKISNGVTRLFRKPENGGNPFLFALLASKPHLLLADAKLARKIRKQDDRQVPVDMPCATAATNGRRYIWHPAFLEKLTTDEVITVMEHESYHIVFYHPERMKHCRPDVRNWAMDYVVNGVIQYEREKTRSKIQLWGGNLGRPLPMSELLDWIGGRLKGANGELILELGRKRNPAYDPDEPRTDHEEDGEGSNPMFLPDPRVFVDPSYYGKSPESIYNQIMDAWEKSPRKCGTCGCLSKHPETGEALPPGPCRPDPKTGLYPITGTKSCVHEDRCCKECGARPSGSSGYFTHDCMPSPMDMHGEAAVTRQEVQGELLRAASQCKSMRGTVPGEVEELLGELMRPTLKFTDLVRNSCLRRAQTAGTHNDWKRFRKRLVPYNVYAPQRHGYKARWLAMIDTSGSMSDDDIRYGISQLLTVATHGAEGFIVPCDATVHWKGLTTVRNANDVRSAKLVGRGGTVFDDFFKQFPSEIGTDFDCVIVITDGECGTVPVELRPPIDVVWVLTRKHKEYKPSFGRVAPLRVEKL